MKSITFYLFYFLYTMSNSLLQPILPQYLKSLNFKQVHYGYSIAFFYFVSFLMSLVWPRMIRLIKLKKSFLVGLLFYVGSSYLFYKTDQLMLFYFSRLLQGISMGILLVTFLSYFFTLEIDEEQIYLYTFVQIMASSIGYFLGTWIMKNQSLSLFLIQIGMGIALIFYLLIVIKEPLQKIQKNVKMVFDKNQITFFIALFCMTLAYFFVENWLSLYLFQGLSLSLLQIEKIRLINCFVSFIIYGIFYFVFRKVRYHFLGVLISCSGLLLMAYLCLKQEALLIVLFLYFGMSNLFLPLQQILLKKKISVHLGIYQGVRFLAMMCSSLFFNSIYQFDSTLILLVSSFGFLLSWLNMRRFLIKN